MTTQPDGTIIYTPFPDYELTDPPTGADTVRTTYRLGGQIVAVQTKVGEAAGAFYFTYTDHLGNISAMSTIAGVYVADSRAWYDPFGTFISDATANPPDANPVPSSNPAISNHGFTGHRHNNTGTNNLGLIYMNARYYLPEIGRFISADTIVPEPTNPQSYNRYSYTRNNPMNFTDPTGHRECGASDGCGGGSAMIPPPPSRPSDFVNPIEDFYDSGYDYLPDENPPHNGVDLSSKTTNDVVALSTGRVRVADACTNDPCESDTSTAANFGTGSVVIVEYAYNVIPESIRIEIQMTSDMSIYIQYQHLDEISAAITVGEGVSAGTIIGEYGNTGCSDGDHLHLEIHMGSSRALGVGFADGTYDTHSNDWHNMTLIDPNLFWSIP